jgi:hypothetical protein
VLGHGLGRRLLGLAQARRSDFTEEVLSGHNPASVPPEATHRQAPSLTVKKSSPNHLPATVRFPRAILPDPPPVPQPGCGFGKALEEVL